MTPSTIKQGMVIGGRYVLLSRIAIGGMGEVWRARDILERKIVAIKVLKVELAGQEQYLARLRLEAANAQRIKHPNAAAVLNSGEEEGLGWLAIELVDGEPLSERIAGGRALSPAQALPIIYGTAQALAAAHAAGVVHRDIKPGNILLTGEGQVKLTDFGISKTDAQETLTQAGMVMGTAQYLPPEQAIGEVATAAGDLYALGVIFYEMLAGKRPFTGKSQVDIAFAHVNTPVPPLPTDLPEPLRQLVAELLEKDPEMRISSAAQLVHRLEEIDRELGLDCLQAAAAVAAQPAAAQPQQVPVPPAAPAPPHAASAKIIPPHAASSPQSEQGAAPAQNAQVVDREPVAHTAPITQLAGGTVPAPAVMPPAIQPQSAKKTAAADSAAAEEFPPAPPLPQEFVPRAAEQTPAATPVPDPADTAAHTEPAADPEPAPAKPAAPTLPPPLKRPLAADAHPQKPAPATAKTQSQAHPNTGNMFQKIRFWLLQESKPAQHQHQIVAYATPLLVIAAAIVIITVAMVIATVTAPVSTQAGTVAETLIHAGGTISCHKLF